MKLKINKKRTKKRKTKKRKLTVKQRKITVWVLVFALITVTVGVASFCLNGNEVPFFETDEEKLSGVDVSEHNGKINWEKLSENIDFAIVRVGYRGYANGVISADKKAKTNLKSAKKADVPVGVYFYSQAITPDEAREEAQFVLDFVRFYHVSLPIFIDYEYAYGKDGQESGRLKKAKLSANDATDILSAFCDEITKEGYTAGVYANSYFYYTKFNPEKLPKDTVKWVADYNEKVTYNGDYDIWQYSKTGTLDGNGSKFIDLDYWYVKK